MMSSTLLDKLLRFVLRCFYRTLHLPQKFQKGDNNIIIIIQLSVGCD